MVGCTSRLTELLTLHGVPVFQLGLCVSLLGHSLSVFFHPFPRYLRSRRSKPSLQMGFLDQRFFFEHLCDNDLSSLPNAIVLEMTHVDYLDWFVRRYEAVCGL